MLFHIALVIFINFLLADGFQNGAKRRSNSAAKVLVNQLRAPLRLQSSAGLQYESTVKEPIEWKLTGYRKPLHWVQKVILKSSKK
jgi:hypothetical protein